MKYRAEIDGMRAVAVVPVILFHAGFETFSGGFVGVDIFFVISGYLITTILVEDIERGCFSLVRFYERRARRILPALFFVVFCCIPFALLWMLPDQLEDFSQSLVAVSLFVSNILFWQEAGYFEATAEEKPLLHTWSLAVEEQYYLLFPLFLILMWRFGRNRVFWMIVGLSALSLLLSEWGWRNRPEANFYLAPTRAWELFAGSIAAFVARQSGVRRNDVLSSAGLILILIAIFAFDETTPFPSVYALVPVVGAVLIILYGDRGTIAARILGHRGLVGIGLISYSAYLWHQPLFAFARLRALTEPGLPLMGALSVLSLGLAVLSWKYVEQPFRKGFTQAQIFAGSSALLVLVAGIGLAGALNRGFIDSYPEELGTILATKDSENPMKEVCLTGAMEPIVHVDDRCWYGDPSEAGTKVLYWGDSHTNEPSLALSEVAADTAVYHAAYANCPPFEGLYRQDMPAECDRFNRTIFEFAQAEGFDVIVLSARWRLYLTGEEFDNGRGGVEPYRVLFDAEASSLGTREDRVAQAIREGLAQVSAANPSSLIIVLGQIPEAGWNVPDYLARSFLNDGRISEAYTLRRHIEEEVAVVNRTFDVAFQLGNVVFLDPVDALCDAQRCVQNHGFDLIYRDDDHLSLYGAGVLAERIAAAMDGAGAVGRQ